MDEDRTKGWNWTDEARFKLRRIKYAYKTGEAKNSNIKIMKDLTTPQCKEKKMKIFKMIIL